MFLIIKKLKIFKKIKKIKRYLKVLVKKQIIIVAIIGFVIGCGNILIKNKSYKKFEKINKENRKMLGVILDVKEKEFSKVYTIKCNNNEYNNEFKNKKFLLYTNKSNNYKIGDLCLIEGNLQEISGRRNYKGFSYKEYLKTKSIYGVIKSNKIKVVDKNKVNVIYKYSISIRDKIKERINLNLPRESSSIMNALLIGDKSDIDDDVSDSFRKSNLSHILAISGLHISYIILGLNFILSKLKFSKKIISIFIIVFLIIYMIITSFSPSVVRASIMGIILMGSNIFYRKQDFWTSISISFLITTFINPFLILNTGLQLSYIATISIVIFFKALNKRNKKSKNIKTSIKNKIKEIIILSVSAQILLLPIIVNLFHTASIYFIISNILITPIFSVVIIIGFIYILISFISVNICSILVIFLNYIMKLFIHIPKAISNLPFSKIYLNNFNPINFVLYYLFVFTMFYFKKEKLKKVLTILLIIFITFNLFNFIYKKTSRNLKIYFIDVGQGDSTLIITPNNKSILIDGGDFDQNILIPYLLNRGIKKIDYIIISHFDSDHVGRYIGNYKRVKSK